MPADLHYADVLAAFDDADRQAGQRCGQLLDDTAVGELTGAILAVEQQTGDPGRPATIIGIADAHTVSRQLSLGPGELADTLGLDDDGRDLLADDGHGAFVPVQLAGLPGDPHVALAGQTVPDWVGAVCLLQRVALADDAPQYPRLTAAGATPADDGTLDCLLLTTMTRTGLTGRGLACGDTTDVSVFPPGTGAGKHGHTIALLARMLQIPAPEPTGRPWLHLAGVWAQWVLANWDDWQQRWDGQRAAWWALPHRPDWLAGKVDGLVFERFDGMTATERDDRLAARTRAMAVRCRLGGWDLAGKVGRAGAPVWAGQDTDVGDWLDGPATLVTLGLTDPTYDSGFGLDLLVVDDDMPQWFCDDVAAYRDTLTGPDGP